MKRAAGCWLVVFLFSYTVPAQEPKLVLPIGHTSSVSTVSFSPDGRYVVSASWDNTAKIWLTPESRLLHELKGHNASLTSAVYSPNGKFIVTTSKDSTARLWRASDGQLLHELRGHKDWVSSASFNKSNTRVATASWDNTAMIWDVLTGKLLVVLKGHTGAVNETTFSPDGAFLVSASKDSTARSWDARTGNSVHTFSGHHDWVNTVRFSNDGRRLLTSSKDGTCREWEVSSGSSTKIFTGHLGAVNNAEYDSSSARLISSSNDGTAILWNAATGEQIQIVRGHKGAVTIAKFGSAGTIVTGGADHSVRLWKVGGEQVGILDVHTAAINHIAVDPAGVHVASASADNTGAIWNTYTRAATGMLQGHTSVVTSAAYSRDGNYLVTASWDNTAKIWNAQDGRLLCNLRGHSNWINSAAFSLDGKFVVTASSDNTARVWSVPDGTLVRELKGHNDWVGSAIFSRDGQFIVTTSWDNTSRVFRTSDGEVVGELKGHSDYIKWINLSSNEQMLVTAAADNTARVWKMPGGEPLQELKGHTDKVRTAEFTSNDKFVITASWDSTARIWDAHTGKLQKTLRGHDGPVNAAMLSPDESIIATTSMDGTARIWSTGTGELKHVLKAHHHSIHSAHFSTDGKRLVLASWDGSASIWNPGNGMLLHVLKGHTAPLKSAAFSPDGRFIITTSEDNTLKKWETESGRFLYTFFAVDSLDFLAIDNDGHYDGSENARKKLYYVCGNELIDLEQFKNLSWEPGLVSKLNGLNNEPITAKKINDIPLCNYTPLVEEKGFSSGRYLFHIKPRSGGVGEIQVYVNNKLVKVYNPGSLSRSAGGYALGIPAAIVQDYLVPGTNNTIVVKATTGQGLMISRGAVQNAGTPLKGSRTPDMYIISIGISAYKSDRLKLKYASKDAADFLSAISSSAKKLLNSDGREHVFSYQVNTEEGNGRWPYKKRIEGLVDSVALKAKPEDIVVIFYAGHGILQAGQKNFLLLTAEAAGPEVDGIEKEVAVNSDELKDWLRRIKASKQLLILDACNSGQVVKQMQELIGQRDIPADQRRALESLKDRTGTFIICASASGQAAYETSLYGQGLLTYSLLSGLKFGNGLRENKFIDVTRWFNHASENVKLLAREIGGRQDPQIIGNASFDIGIVDRDIVNNIRLSNKKQVFRNSVFILDNELLNDDLELSSLVNRELSQVANSAANSPWIFVADNTLLDAFTVRGRYEVDNKKINVKVSVYRGHKERVHQFDISGIVDEKDQLARKIVETTRTYMNQMAKGTL